MPEAYAFEPDVQYELGGIGYRILKSLSQGQVLVKNLMTGDVTAQQIKHLSDEWHAHRLAFGLDGRNLREEEGHAVKTSYVFTDLDFIENLLLKQETWDRYQLVLLLIDIPATERTDEEIREKIKTYVTSQIALIASGERTSPIFPQRSGKPKKKTSSEQYNVESTSSSLEKTPQSVKGEATQICADVPLQRISSRAVRRWIKDFEKSRRDIRSLVPQYYNRGRREVAMSSEVKELLKIAVTEVYETEQRAQVTKVIEKLEFLILQANATRPDGQPALIMPNKRKVYRYIDQLDPMEVDIARMGRRYAERKHKQYGRGPRPTRPNERWEEDDTLADLFVVDEDGLPIGRPLFTAVRDKCCGVVPGINISFEPSSARTVMECLFYAIPEKKHVKQLFGLRNDYVGYGVPEVLAVDRGRGYIGNDIQLACAQLGIELDPMPGRSPWLKGSIEHFIKDTGTDIFHATSGTTFSNFLVRGDYDPAKHACVTLDGLWYIVHKWIVDVYTRAKHRGVGGVPAKLWERALERDFFPRLPPSRKALSVLLSRVEYRVVQEKVGIDFEHLRYQDNRFSDLRHRLLRLSREKKSLKTKNEKEDASPFLVQFKYNPSDLSRIWVLDPDRMQYLEVLAEDQEYTQGLSIWKHRVIERYIREQIKQDIDHETLILAKEELRQAMNDEFRLGKKLKTRKNAARFLGMEVSNALRGNQPSNSSAVEISALSQLSTLEEDVLSFELAATEVVPPHEEIQVTPSLTVVGSIADLNVPLPQMIEGVALPVNDETMEVGNRLLSSGKEVPEQEVSAENRKKESIIEVLKGSTDPDESTSFGITRLDGALGPT